MKNFLVLTAIILTSFFNASANSYDEAMKTNIQKIDQSTSVDELVNLANAFERIGQKEAEKWLPFYYAAYAHVYVLFINREASADEKNSVLDKAQEQLDKAIKLNANESENYALQGLIYQMRITDPSLGQKFSALSNESFGKALTLNPNNARAYYLKATNLLYTPAEYGGGKTVALPLFQKAAKLFEVEPEDKLLPNWGGTHNKMMIEQCNN